MTVEDLIKEYLDPQNVWLIRRVEDKKILAHGYWNPCVSGFDEYYNTGEYYMEPLTEKAPVEAISKAA